METEVLNRVMQLIDKLTDNYYKQPSVGAEAFKLFCGVKYHKIVFVGAGTSVHAFVDRRTGEVYKPASWRSPAKHVRYKLLDDVSFQNCLKNCDWAGSYLYLK